MTKIQINSKEVKVAKIHYKATRELSYFFCRKVRNASMREFSIPPPTNTFKQLPKKNWMKNYLFPSYRVVWSHPSDTFVLGISWLMFKTRSQLLFELWSYLLYWHNFTKIDAFGIGLSTRNQSGLRHPPNTGAVWDVHPKSQIYIHPRIFLFSTFE
jgi:hypothetical protein